MSTGTAEANTIFNEDNYFVWEYITRMKLAKKRLLKHLYKTKYLSKGVVNAASWIFNDMEVFANVCTMVSTGLQSIVRSAQMTAEAWDISSSFKLRRSIRN